MLFSPKDFWKLIFCTCCGQGRGIFPVLHLTHRGFPAAALDHKYSSKKRYFNILLGNKFYVYLVFLSKYQVDYYSYDKYFRLRYFIVYRKWIDRSEKWRQSRRNIFWKLLKVEQLCWSPDETKLQALDLQLDQKIDSNTCVFPWPYRNYAEHLFCRTLRDVFRTQSNIYHILMLRWSFCAKIGNVWKPWTIFPKCYIDIQMGSKYLSDNCR